jgi:hypothetical protein
LVDREVLEEKASEIYLLTKIRHHHDGRIVGEPVIPNPGWFIRQEFERVPSRAPKGNGLLTAGGLLIRDSESFGSNFRAEEGTKGVPFGPWLVSLETETFPATSRSS